MAVADRWDTPAGEAARRNTYRLLASGEGPVADFAKDVVDGRRQARDLASFTGLPDDLFARAHAVADRWRRLPEESRTMIAERATEFFDRYIEVMAEVDVDALVAGTGDEPAPERAARAPAPPDDDEWFDRPYLRDH